MGRFMQYFPPLPVWNDSAGMSLVHVHRLAGEGGALGGEHHPHGLEGLLPVHGGALAGEDAVDEGVDDAGGGAPPLVCSLLEVSRSRARRSTWPSGFSRIREYWGSSYRRRMPWVP